MAPGDALRVLIIDDDAEQRAIVARLLVRDGIPDVTAADSAEAGLTAAAELQPHLILLDLVMPGRSGSEVLPDLLDAAPSALVVILSNLPRRRVAPGLMQRGAVGYVEKFVPAQRLVHEILVAAALTDVARRHLLELPDQPTAPLLGRRFARALLADADLSMADDVALLVSELVSNAVVHASSRPRLEVRIGRSQVRVEVRDESPEQALPRTPDLETPGGRGLLLIETLASRWGTDRDVDAKRVWFEIDREPPGSGT
ncbi:MAG: response regulator receiver [Acidimicrobiales bacterium]|nr:response regulator receiver [Acidimicrobiales bacterium]